MSGTTTWLSNIEGAGLVVDRSLHLDPQQQSQAQVQQGHQPSSPEVDIEIPLESLRSLYLPSASPLSLGIGQFLRRGSTSITYKTVPLEFPPITRLDPFNKKRILVTGVSLGLMAFVASFVSFGMSTNELFDLIMFGST